MKRQSNALLIDEPPLQVLPSLATALGVDDAIFLQQLHYWLRQPSREIYDDLPWVYNSYEQWHVQFPWWSVSTLRRIVGRLEKSGLVISRQVKEKEWDHRKWYTIDYDVMYDFIEALNLNTSKRSPRSDQTAQSDLILKETKTTPKNDPYSKFATPDIEHMFENDP